MKNHVICQQVNPMLVMLQRRMYIYGLSVILFWSMMIITRHNIQSSRIFVLGMHM